METMEEIYWKLWRRLTGNTSGDLLETVEEIMQWSSALVHIGGQMTTLPGLTDWLEESEIENYRRFVCRDGDEADIRKATSTGRPLGGLEFISGMEKLTGRILRPKKAGRPKKTN